MEYYAKIKNDDFLEHYGILGQKWGSRNGPPYPLDSESHSSEEKKLNPGIGVKYDDKYIREQVKKTAKKIEKKKYKVQKSDFKKEKMELVKAKVEYQNSESRAERKLNKFLYKAAKEKYKLAESNLAKAKQTLKDSKKFVRNMDDLTIKQMTDYLRDNGYNEANIDNLMKKGAIYYDE